MRLAFSFFRGRITEQSGRPNVIPTVLLALAYIILLSLFSGCRSEDNAYRPAPDTVSNGVFILGADAEVMAGVNLSSFYRSFLARIRMEFGGEGEDVQGMIEQQRRTLSELGLDPNVDDITVVLSLASLPPRGSPSLALFAPIPIDGLESLSQKMDWLERLEVQVPSSAADDVDVPVYAVRDGDETLMLAQPAASTLLATPSVHDLAEMLMRSRQLDVADVDQRALFSRVAGEDAWFVMRASGTMLPGRASQIQSPEIASVLRAIENVGGSIRIHPESATFTLYLEPRDGVATDDLSDLIRGVLALFKLNAETRPALMEVIKEVNVSETAGFCRVHLKLTESLVERLVSPYRPD